MKKDADSDSQLEYANLNPDQSSRLAQVLSKPDFINVSKGLDDISWIEEWKGYQDL